MDAHSLVIAGTGAMACLFAGRLRAAGIPVTMLGTWSEGLEALHRDGLRITGGEGEEHTYTVRAVSDPQACQGALYALVLVKSWQTERIARQLSECLEEQGIALTLQNGVGNRETLAQRLGSPRVAAGVTTIGANLVGPGRVRLAGDGVISLGVHARLKPLAELLRKAEFVVETVTDIQSLLWGKLVINAAINPLTAILQVPNGELVTRPTARQLLASVAREAAGVAVARGIHLPYPDPVVAVESIAQRTGKNLSSMLQDVKRGAPSEIDVINGAIVRAGEQTGVPTPYNRALWLLVRSLVIQNHPPRSGS